MASHRRPKPPTRTRVSVLTALATAAVALSAQSAHAAPDKPKKDEVKEQVDALYEESEQAGEKANAAKDRQDKLEKEIGRLQDQVARGQADLNDLRNTLGSMATAQYAAAASTSPWNCSSRRTRRTTSTSPPCSSR